MSYNRTLGICIPTYKRPDQLLLCVRSVIAAARPFDVPVFITDDAVDDTNTAAIAQLQSTYPYIVYSKNNANLGIDRNIIHAANVCDCSYAWLLGEDDRMLPGSIEMMLRVLGQDPAPAFVVANYSYVDDAMSTVLRERVLDVKENTVMSAEAFFRVNLPAICFIGACVINRGLWEQSNREQYLDTYYAHVGTIMENLLDRHVHIIAEPLVLNRVGGAETTTWSGDAFTVMVGGWSKLIRLLEPIYGADACRAAARCYEARHRSNSLRFLCAMRADGRYNLQVYREFIAASPRSRLGKLAARLVATTSPAPFKLIRACLDTVRKSRNAKVTIDSV